MDEPEEHTFIHLPQLPNGPLLLKPKGVGLKKGPLLNPNARRMSRPVRLTSR